MTASHPRRELLGLALVALLAAALPLATRDNYLLSVGIFIALYGMVALGLGLLLGYAGQVSLGHAAFYGLGAYGSALLCLRLHLDPWLALLLAAAGTGALAWLVGRPTLRLHGNYLAMATLGLGVIVTILFNEGGEFTGGPSGLTGIPDLRLGSLVFDTDLRMYAVAWPLFLVQMLLARNLLQSRWGRALRALHDSEVAAQSCAVDTARCKLLVFVLSAIFASVAGSLYAYWVNFVNPGPFGFAFSIHLVVMVVVGGAATLWGPLVGAAALTVLAQALSRLGSIYAPAKDLDVVLFGVLLIVVLLFMPRGLSQLGRSLRRRDHAT